jgi:hypothetical protein
MDDQAKPLISCQFSAMRPVSGGIWPLNMLNQMDFPAPFGPITASISPATSVP